MSCWRMEFFTYFSQTNEMLIFRGKIGENFYPATCHRNPTLRFRTLYLNADNHILGNQPMTVELYLLHFLYPNRDVNDNIIISIDIGIDN